MKSLSKIFVVFLSLLICAAASSQDISIKHRLKGSLKNRIYTSPEGDYQVLVPTSIASEIGGNARDEKLKDGPVASQVIFTNDFGAFYRIVSLRPSNLTPDDVIARVLHDVRSKDVIETSRGREWRVINIEQEGAEVIATTVTRDGKAEQTRPDLLTANAMFVANGHIYHVIAGRAVTAVRLEGKTEKVREDLDEFLSGFRLLRRSN